jgi:NhaP-type Na+/H+ or K+/H+ antiporter
MLWFVPLLFLAVRPLAVGLGTVGARVSPLQRRLIAWFGIRGIGSFYYLMFAARHGLEPGLAERLADYTLIVIAASIVLHGVSVTPLMRGYERRQRDHRK